MNPITGPYLGQKHRWPASGHHILVRFDAESVVVYQAYRPDIGHFAARHGSFEGEGEAASAIGLDFFRVVAFIGGLGPVSKAEPRGRRNGHPNRT